MPQGLAKIKQFASEAAARQKAWDEGVGTRPLVLKDGETAYARFLEEGEGVWFVWTHQLPRQSGQQFGDRCQCLDQDDQGQPCSACVRQIPRGGRVSINLIHYGAPKFKREEGKDGKVGKLIKDNAGNPIEIGKEDVVVTWDASQAVGGRLAHLFEKHGTLTGAIFSITRQGTGKSTSYMIDFERMEPPSENDQKLYAKKPDPRKAIKQITFGDMERLYAAVGGGTGVPEAGMGMPSGETNSFAAAAAGAAQRGAFAGPAPSAPAGGGINPDAFK